MKMISIVLPWVCGSVNRLSYRPSVILFMVVLAGCWAQQGNTGEATPKPGDVPQQQGGGRNSVSIGLPAQELGPVPSPQNTYDDFSNVYATAYVEQARQEMLQLAKKNLTHMGRMVRVLSNIFWVEMGKTGLPDAILLAFIRTTTAVYQEAVRSSRTGPQNLDSVYYRYAGEAQYFMKLGEDLDKVPLVQAKMVRRCLELRAAADSTIGSGDFLKAIKEYRELLELAAPLGRDELLYAHFGLGAAHASLNEDKSAIAHFDQALELAVRMGNRIAERDIYANLEILYHHASESAKADQYRTKRRLVESFLREAGAEKETEGPTRCEQAKALAEEWWSLRDRDTGICDVCNKSMDRNEGYLVDTQDMLQSVEYIDRTAQMLIMMGMSEAEARESVRRRLEQDMTSWLICRDCIGMIIPSCP